jgi:hypothetical protein
MKKVYISGKITGLPMREVAEQFGRAEACLKEQGYEAVSPLRNGMPADAPYELHMAVDTLLLAGCQAIYMLSGWELSKGATLERDLAEATGKQVLYEKTPSSIELMPKIKQAVAAEMGVSFHDVVNGGRARSLVYARMLYAHFCRERGVAIKNVAAETKRNHSTIIYYLRKFDDDSKFNPKFRDMVSRIEAALSHVKSPF